MNHPECKVIFLSLITRTDYQTLTEKLIDFNEHFFDICKSKKYDIDRSGNYGHGLQMEMHQIYFKKQMFLSLYRKFTRTTRAIIPLDFTHFTQMRILVKRALQLQVVGFGIPFLRMFRPLKQWKVSN